MSRDVWVWWLILVFAFVFDLGDAGVRDGRDRGTIVVENRRLKSENESLKKKERGERVLRVGLEMEKVSEM